jgi:cytochrome c553
MKIKFALLFTAASIILSSAQTQAQSLIDGSADAGKASAITCNACHGTEGNSANPTWPSIAGQNAPYLLAQMKAFKDGTRSDPLMTSQAMLLSDEDMANLAVYFESLPSAAQAIADVSLLDRGESLYRGGNLEDKTSACLACHGPTGRGNPAAKYPALRGQHATYTAKQLHDYKNAARTSDGKNRIMQDIAARLSKDDIVALSSYVQGLK